jgi:cell division protein FtsI/penicillin-binding protein 2
MRKALLPLIIIIATSLLLIRIFYLQVVNDTFKLQSENNAIKIKYDYPERGYIYDRYGKLLVANQPSYDIMVIPREIKKIDTLEFCKLLDISKEDFIKKKSGLDLVIKTVKDKLPVLLIEFNGLQVFNNPHILDVRRVAEVSKYHVVDNRVGVTSVVFDEILNSKETALYSIYTTLFVVFLLLVFFFFFLLFFFFFFFYFN